MYFGACTDALGSLWGHWGHAGAYLRRPYRFSRRAAVSSASVQATPTPELLESYLTREILVYQKIGNLIILIKKYLYIVRDVHIAGLAIFQKNRKKSHFLDFFELRPAIFAG